jgi:HEAT repeat protein
MARTPPSYLDIVGEPKAPPPFFTERLRPLTEVELREALVQDAKQVDLDTEKGTTDNLLKQMRKGGNGKADNDTTAKDPPILRLIAERPDLKGLPVRNTAACQLNSQEAHAMGIVSSTIGTGSKLYLCSLDGSVSYTVTVQLRACLVGILEQEGKAWRDDVSVRTLAQILQTGDLPVRLTLLKTLSQTMGEAAGTALAQRAVFDFSPEVRQAAVKALKARPHEEYRSVLLEALRYPWAPVADRAAEALVALEDREAAGQLVDLLSMADPRAPSKDKNQKWKVPELVRVNHLNSCLLCHAPSVAEKGVVPGIIPERSKSLLESYSKPADFVRADVTYLKQDFSVMESVSDPGKWPRIQRFDYLIRQRELGADEVARLDKVGETTHTPASYPQREAVLWTLRELTGEDAGDKAEDWYEFLVPYSCAPGDL